MISIIIPAYNAEKTIAQCIHSLLHQTEPQENYEIIVVNDGSTDRTEELLKSLGIKYCSQINQGPAAARNKGVALAQGDIILFTDSDCVAERNWIREMTAPFKNPKIAGVKGRYQSTQKGIIPRFVQLEFEERYRLLEKYNYIDFVDTYSAGFRKEVFLAVGGFDPSFPQANNEDVDLSYRLAQKGYTMVYNPKAIIYHQHPKTLSNYLRIKFWRGYWRLMVYQRYPKKALKDTYTPFSLKAQIALFYLLILSIPIPIFITGTYPLPPLIFASFLITTLPFSYAALIKDPLVAILSPFLIFLRAAAIGLGSLKAILSTKRLS
jgi:cellulose synthase/poly-beta-1,6-N-acetylglucosamine synthase-like glycosyltransferase